MPRSSTSATTDPSWPAAVGDNRAELLSYLGSGACLESYRATNIAWVLSGVPDAGCNGVIWARLSAEEADQLGPVLVDRFRLQNLPALWHVDGYTQPGDLGARLERLGCHRTEPVTLAASVVSVTRGLRDLPHLTVERVTTPDDLSTWMDVWTEVTGEPRQPREKLYMSLGLRRLEPLRHYMARLNGRPVGVSQLFLGQQAAGLYSVAVRVDYRGLGIGRAVAQFPLVEARTLGYDLAVASPPADSLPFFAALGLQRFMAPFPSYEFTPSNDGRGA